MTARHTVPCGLATSGAPEPVKHVADDQTATDGSKSKAPRSAGPGGDIRIPLYVMAAVATSASRCAAHVRIQSVRDAVHPGREGRLTMWTSLGATAQMKVAPLKMMLSGPSAVARGRSWQRRRAHSAVAAVAALGPIPLCLRNWAWSASAPDPEAGLWSKHALLVLVMKAVAQCNPAAGDARHSAGVHGALARGVIDDEAEAAAAGHTVQAGEGQRARMVAIPAASPSALASERSLAGPAGAADVCFRFPRRALARPLRPTLRSVHHLRRGLLHSCRH